MYVYIIAFIYGVCEGRYKYIYIIYVYIYIHGGRYRHLRGKNEECFKDTPRTIVETENLFTKCFICSLVLYSPLVNFSKENLALVPWTEIFHHTLWIIFLQIYLHCFIYLCISRWKNRRLNNSTRKHTYKWRIKQRILILQVFYATNLTPKNCFGNSFPAYGLFYPFYFFSVHY